MSLALKLPLPDCPGYFISEDGAVYGPKGLRKQQIGSSGYREVSIYGGRKRILVHRYVARAFLGEPPSAQHNVAHNDGNKLNNHYSNLRWATQAENLADKKIHGTYKWGENGPGAKLTLSQVREIVAKYRSGGISQKALAAAYGIVQAQVSRIVLGHQWAHL